MYSPHEIRVHVCGIKNIDLTLLRDHTMYREGLSAEDVLFQNFWDVVLSLDNELKARFVDFVYAQKRLPSAEEFRRRKLRLLISVLECENPDQTLPQSQTCFLNLQIPRYSSKEILKRNLLVALKSSSGFAEEQQDVME